MHNIYPCFNDLQEAEDNQQQGGALLDEQEMKIIFAGLVPIREGDGI